MNNIITYHPLLKGIVYVLLIGQLWVGMVSYCNWLIDTNIELIELCDFEDSEPIEEENIKDKDDKLKINLFASKFGISLSRINILYSEDILSLHYPESTTPPPEHFVS